MSQIQIAPYTPPVESLFWDQREGRRRGLIGAFLCAVVLVSLFVWREILPPAEIDTGDLGHLLYSTCWITYDPSGKKLDRNRLPVYPETHSIEADLDLIRLAGFNGIVTSSSDGAMAVVPRLAKDRGLKVIMGIWNPIDRRELSHAIKQSKYVDAYYVGNNGLTVRYSHRQLEGALVLVKKRTRRPATTSELVTYYRGRDRLIELGDWLFPDAHVTVKDNPTNMTARVDLAGF